LKAKLFWASVHSYLLYAEGLGFAGSIYWTASELLGLKLLNYLSTSNKIA